MLVAMVTFWAKNKLFEYAMAGLPSLVSNLPEMSPVVTKYGLGKIVPPYNVEIQISAINELLKKNQRDKIRKTAIQNFTWDTQANKLLQIILG